MAKIDNKKLAIEWLKVANDDLDSISYIIDTEHLINIVAFHLQQAIEKSFKALMLYKKDLIIKTHNLERLYKKIENYIDIDFDRLELINEFYIESRYPGDMGLLPNGKPTLEDAKEFYNFALEVFDKVCETLNIDRSELK